MNEIIESLIQWCTENKFMVDISTRSNMGGFWVDLTLRRGKFNYKHYFYIAGGVFCIDDWRGTKCDEELKYFLEEAKEKFKEAEEDVL